MFDILMILSGLVLLFLGGEGLIKGAVSIARNFGLSKLLVSAVLVGFGTSMPEMTVSVSAAIKGAPDIAVGNVVGSNIANILLIVGIAAVIYPILIAGNAVKRDALIMIAASFTICMLALSGMIPFIAGVLMLAALIAYVFWAYRADKAAGLETVQHIEQDIEGEVPLSVLKASVFSFFGLILLVIGAYLLVEGAISIAQGFGISEAVIGLTIVAVGTSLPELATTLVAAFKKHGDVIIGNIVGSNIFNILAIMGVTAIISPIPVGEQIANFDVWIMLAAAVFLSIYLLRGLSIGRVSGLFMLLIYVIYTLWLYTTSGA